jgi:hypothetical protein
MPLIFTLAPSLASARAPALRVLSVICPQGDPQKNGPGELLHRQATMARRKDETKPEFGA